MFSCTQTMAPRDFGAPGVSGWNTKAGMSRSFRRLRYVIFSIRMKPSLAERQARSVAA